MVADLLVTARGLRSATYGPRTIGLLGRRYLPNEQIDLFIAAHMDDAALERQWSQASAEAQSMLRGYVAGYNRFLADRKGQLPPACAGKDWVKPMTLPEYRRLSEITAVQAGIAALADGMVGARPPAPGTAQGAAGAVLQGAQEVLEGGVPPLVRAEVAPHAGAEGVDPDHRDRRWAPTPGPSARTPRPTAAACCWATRTSPGAARTASTSCTCACRGRST